jgi:uracil-DNA glycosylase
MAGPYLFDTHPIIHSDKDCASCGLGKLRLEHNARAIERDETPVYCVSGNGPEDLTKVKLIVISDYPGAYEVTQGYPMVDKYDIKPAVVRGKVQPQNAGGFLRQALRMMYGLDSYNDVWITNAVKCNPATATVVETQHLRPCVKKWLVNELNVLDRYCPKVPILTLGTQAFRAVRFMYDNQTDAFQAGYKACRRKVHWVGERPVVVSFNPAIAARSQARIETQVKKTKHNGVYVAKTDWLYPPLPGSPVDRFINDLRCLSEVLQTND